MTAGAAVPGGGTIPASHPVIETARLRLRPLVAEDIRYLHPVFSDPEAMRFMDFPPARDLADSARYIECYLIVLPDWHATWALECRATGAVIGLANYHHRENANRRLEIGFLLARPHWQRGFMREALRAVLDDCFDRLGMERIEATMSPGNHAAIRLVEVLGFQREGGPMRRRQRVGTEFRDLLMYGLLRNEWQGGEGQRAEGRFGKA